MASVLVQWAFPSVWRVVMIPLLLLLTAYTYNHNDWLNLPAMDAVVSITADNYDGYVAVKRGVYVISKTDRRVKRTITASDGIRGTIRCVGYDRETQQLWILASGNLLSINPFTNASWSYELPDASANALGIATNYIFLAHRTEYYRLDKRTGQFDELPPAGARVAWYGDRSPYEPDQYPFLVPYLYFDRHSSSHPITCVYPDGRRLWVGTEGYGFLLYNLNSKLQLGRWQFGPADDYATRIFRFNEDLWFAAEGQLTRYVPARDSWNYFTTPFNAWYPEPLMLLRSKVLDLNYREPILTLTGDTSELWIGTERGIYSYQPGANVLTRELKLTSTASSMLMTPDSIFVGTSQGLISFDRQNRGWTLFDDTLRQMHFGIYGIAATERRRYFAVHGGLETQDSLGEWEQVIPPGWNLASYPDGLAAAGNKLFIGTRNGVIVHDDRRGDYVTLTTESGLMSNRVRGLYADEHYLWVATDAGVSRFDHTVLMP